MTTPVMVEIVPAYTTDEHGNYKNFTVSYKVDNIDQPSNTVGVRNSVGSTLPITGGVGTTVLYILGAVLVLGAAVLLVSRKRAVAED